MEITSFYIHFLQCGTFGGFGKRKQTHTQDSCFISIDCSLVIGYTPCLRSRKGKCPMRGDCCHSDVIYHATVKEEGEEDRKYVGSAKNFKKRYYGHAASFRDSDKKHNTALSTHVWERELNPEPEIEWSILAHAPAYSKGNRNCDLCLTEKLHIARNFSDPAYLNRRSELAQRCRHKPTFLLQPPAKKGNGDEG